MSTITLYPSITQIERGLFAIPDDLLIRLAEQDPNVPAALREAAMADESIQESINNLRQTLQQDNAEQETLASTEPPAFIKTLISQKVASSQAHFGTFPESGQMVQISQLPTPSGEVSDLQIATPLTVLLNTQNKTTQIWHGWMMAAEVQYAGFWDMLLEPGDEPFDPICGMVQIWNPVQLYIPQDFKAKVAGRLNPARMLAVRALAEEYLLGDPLLPRSRPGFIAMRPTCHDNSILTGSPLGDHSDPRHRYQQCYHHVAQLLNQPVLVWQTAPVSHVNLLAELQEAIAVVWQQLTGGMVQSVAAVEYAMSDDADNNQVIMALDQDLQLSLTQTDHGIDVSLRYTGENQLSICIIDDGEQARSGILDTQHTTLDYLSLNVTADNHLLIDYPDGKHLDLPLTLSSL